MKIMEVLNELSWPERMECISYLCIAPSQKYKGPARMGINQIAIEKLQNEFSAPR